MSDALLSPTDIEEHLSLAYVHAVAAAAGYTIATANADRDGIDLTIGAGGALRPKLDVQVKATTNLGVPIDGSYRFELKVRNYDLLRLEAQTPRFLVVLDLPADRESWVAVLPEQLVLRRCAFWVTPSRWGDTTNSTTVTISVPAANLFNVEALRRLMEQSRKARLK